MKQKLLIIFITVVVILGIGGILATNQPQKLGVFQSLALCETSTSNLAPASGATTTNPALVSFLTVGGASSTLTCYVERADAIDANIALFASTSATVLHWGLEFSDDAVTWYAEDTKTVVTETLTRHSATTTHTWAATSANDDIPVGKNVTITPTGSKYMRIKSSVSGAAGAVHYRLHLRERVN